MNSALFSYLRYFRVKLVIITTFGNQKLIRNNQ